MLMIIVLCLFPGLIIVYLFIIRPWHLRWGATQKEVELILPGDNLVIKPNFNATRAIAINAEPELIWRWIIQMGSLRAGWYSVDPIDNGGVKSSDKILGEFQNIAINQFIPFTPNQKNGMWVKDFKKYQYILWVDKIGNATWLWHLIPDGNNKTRLLTRLKTKYIWKGFWIIYYLLFDMGDIIIMSRCMKGIKRRAEFETAKINNQESKCNKKFIHKMKYKKSMIYLLIFIALIAITFIAGKINLSIKFNKQVKDLFAQSKDISNQNFSYLQLADLPEPVQRYFKHVLKDGQPYISYVRLQHDGQFKTDLKKDWVNIEGEQYFTTEKPGFIWKGTTSMFVARDMYLGNEGRLIATILSTVNVVDVHGKQQYNESELLRWLSESVWFPTNLLPSEKLQWTAIDDSSAKLTFNYSGLSLFYIINFNDKGEIMQMETKRYMDEKRLETWIIKPNNYEERSGIIIPIHAEVFWRLKEGDFSYAKFNVKTIEYNIAEIF